MKKHGWISKTLSYIKEVKQKWWVTILINFYKILQKTNTQCQEADHLMQETSFLMRSTAKGQDETF